MKGILMKTLRILTLFLALLMLLSVLAACGDQPVETTKGAETTAKVEEEDPRQLVKDTVPTDVNYSGETVTFFVRLREQRTLKVNRPSRTNFIVR